MSLSHGIHVSTRYSMFSIIFWFAALATCFDLLRHAFLIPQLRAPSQSKSLTEAIHQQADSALQSRNGVLQDLCCRFPLVSPNPRAVWDITSRIVVNLLVHYPLLFFPLTSDIVSSPDLTQFSHTPLPQHLQLVPFFSAPMAICLFQCIPATYHVCVSSSGKHVLG